MQSLRDLYEAPLVLISPDQRVAWRDFSADAAKQVLSQATGRSPPGPESRGQRGRLPSSIAQQPQQCIPFQRPPDADGDEARTLRPLQATAVTYRIPSAHAPGTTC